MSKYRKKPILPVVIEAFKWEGWTDGSEKAEFPDWAIEAFKKDQMRFRHAETPQVSIQIDTREGRMHALRGDYIIQGIKEELYPCKPLIFEAIYEPVDD